MDNRRFFFILGAPKCGTTSLALWLSEHPDICFSTNKEPHFFNSDMLNRDVRDWNQYNRLFVKPEQAQYLAEASTWYLYSHVAVKNIESAFENPKYIVMVRDPAEMVLSLHQQNIRDLHEDQQDLEVAWKLQSERKSGRRIPRGCADPVFLQYREICSLGSLVERLYAQVPVERVHLIHLDAIRQDPKQVYRNVLEFLRLPDDGREHFEPQNEAVLVKSAVFQKIIVYLYALKIRLGIQRSFGLSTLNLKRGKMTHSERFIHDVLEREMADEKEKLAQYTAVD